MMVGAPPPHIVVDAEFESIEVKIEALVLTIKMRTYLR